MIRRLFFTLASLLSITLFFSEYTYSQNLFEERIRKVTDQKTSIFLDKGIFHTGSGKTKSTLKSIRQHYRKKTKTERVVLDFKTNNIPRIYGHVSKGERKMYIDMFDTSLEKDFATFGESKLVKSIDFFPIHNRMLSAEIIFHKDVLVDIFYLENPGRFVIDAKR